jgi:hypothetical protein
LIIIWDGAPIHRDKQVKAFLVETAGAVRLEQLPGYAPDLNPDEAVWQQLKHVELANVVCHDQDELRPQLRRAIARLRRRPDMIRDFIEHYRVLDLYAPICSSYTVVPPHRYADSTSITLAWRRLAST